MPYSISYAICKHAMKEDKHSWYLQMPQMYQTHHLRHSWHWIQVDVQQQSQLYWGLAAHRSKLDLHSCQYQKKKKKKTLCCHFSVMKKQNISACFPSLFIDEINFPSCPLFFFSFQIVLDRQSQCLHSEDIHCSQFSSLVFPNF